MSPRKNKLRNKAPQKGQSKSTSKTNNAHEPILLTMDERRDNAHRKKLIHFSALLCPGRPTSSQRQPAITIKPHGIVSDKTIYKLHASVIMCRFFQLVHFLPYTNTVLSVRGIIVVVRFFGGLSTRMTFFSLPQHSCRTDVSNVFRVDL